jgi:hypothetical protein
MKKKIVIELPVDTAAQARRKARATAGSPQATRVLTPKHLKPPKHKKKVADQE